MILSLILLAAAPQPWPIKASFVQEATGMPGIAGADVFTSGPHPGLVVGTEYRYLRAGRFALIGTYNLGGFSHGAPSLDGLFALTELAPRLELPFGLSAELALGAGYFHALSFAGIVKDGAHVADAGRPSALVSLRLGAQLMLPGNRIGVFLAYQVMVQTPTALTPVLPRSLLHAGISVPLTPVPGDGVTR